jgi:hypothetical protein
VFVVLLGGFFLPLQASLVIRTLLEREGLKYVIVVEHDLSILDYLSDFICVLYGVPSAYGVVTMPFNVRDGRWVSRVWGDKEPGWGPLPCCFALCPPVRLPACLPRLCMCVSM